jgi:hypothetical protein
MKYFMKLEDGENPEDDKKIQIPLLNLESNLITEV